MIKSAPTDISVADPAALNNAAISAADSLLSYYKPNFSGSIPSTDASDSSGVQWYESGILWETMMRSTQATGSEKFIDTITGALMNASYGATGNFLGTAAAKESLSSLFNQWNDDIGWWGMAAISGAEIYSSTTAQMPGGSTYYQLAVNTAEDMWFGWDASTCGGGIFWTRSRSVKSSSANVNLKSTITNAQYMSYAARLYMLGGNRTILDEGIAVYNWLKLIGLADPVKGLIYDGADAPTCSNAQSHPADSYIYGQLIEGLVLMNKATNESSYLADAEAYAQTALSIYSQNNVIRDTCEPQCPPNRVSPKGILIRGLYTYYPVATPATKAKIFTLINTSFVAMLKTCDANYNCNNNWGPEGTVYSDVHCQLNAVELFNAAVFVNSPSTKKFNKTLSTPSEPTKGNADSLSSIMGGVASIVGLLFL